jgi:hypothetical protein
MQHEHVEVKPKIIQARPKISITCATN